MKGVILDQRSFDRDDIDTSRLHQSPIEWKVYQSTPNHEVGSRICDAEVVITNKVKLDANTIAATPSLKLILIAATGTDNVDLNACKTHDVIVCNARGYTTPAVVQHVFSLTLNLMTQVIRYHELVRQGKWQESDVFCLLDYPINELAGKTLGIIGFGTLGNQVATVAQGFGMDVLICQRPGGPNLKGRVALDELLPKVDVLSIHCPLTEHTKHLISTAQLARMKSNAILINTARGAIVDSDALIEALKHNRIGGAGIDVLDIEPPTSDHPLIANQLPNLIVTPHIAWASRESRQRLVAQLADNLTAWLNDQPVNTVEPT